MVKILEYDKNLLQSEGAFIFNNDKIEYIGLRGHASYAMNYLLGPDYYQLLGLKHSHDKEVFNDYKRTMNMNWENQSDVNEFLSSNLNEEQLELFKKWQEEFEFKNRNYYTDFMVEVLGIDKVSTLSANRISSIKKQPHIYYFNYIISGFEIDARYPMEFNKKDNCFKYSDMGISSTEWLEDKKYEDEANDIKLKVPVKDRYLFFK